MDCFTVCGKSTLSIIIVCILNVSLLLCDKNTEPKQRSLEYSNAKVLHQKCKPDTFTVAFYNLENLFDFEHDGTEYPEYIPGKSSWTREVQLVKINSIAEVIAAIDADIIGMCEIEDEDALDDLNEGLKRYNTSYKFRVIGTAEKRTVTCPALLSRFPIAAFRTHHVNLMGRGITRDILEVDVQVCDRPLKIFVNHWPSKQHPESQRFEAAKVLASRLSSLAPGTEYILMGDFNADYNEFQSFSSFRLNDTNGKTGVNHLLKTCIIDSFSIQYVTKNNIVTAGNGAHYDMWLELPETKRMSSVYNGNNQTPDHILIPAVMFDATGLSYLDKSFNMVTWDSKLLKDGKPFRWQIKWVKKHKVHLGLGYSDHLPVKARFTNVPFAHAADSSIPDPGPIPIRTGTREMIGSVTIESFEQSTGGWIACINGVSVVRDSLSAAHGRFSLKIDGPPMKSNATVARTVLTQSGSSQPVRLSVKGSGKISFRMRATGGDWIYFNAPEFKPSKVARYRESTIVLWKQVELEHNVSSAEELEFEIRVAKEAPFMIWIDNVK